MINRSITIRVVTSLFGAMLNIYLATFLIDNFGPDFYAIYIQITSLPLLMLWADFGLGALVLNTFTDARHNLLPPEIVRQRINFSFYFILSLGLIFLLILVAALKTWGLGIDNPDTFSRTSLLCILVVGITTFAVPFSLGAKKFQADNEYLKVIKFQSMIPLSISLVTLIVAKLLPFNSGLIILVPSLVYFLNTILIFFKSGLGSYLTLPRFIYFNTDFLQHIRLGLWSLILTTLIGITFQLPKYIISVFKSNYDVTIYGLQSLLIIPGISFLAIPALITIPKFRVANQNRVFGQLYSNTLAKTRLLAWLLALATFLAIPFQNILKIDRLTSSQILQVCIIFIFTPKWILPALTITEMQDIRKVARRFLFVMFLALMVTFILRNATSFWILNGFFATIYLGYRVSVSHKIKYFKN